MIRRDKPNFKPKIRKMKTISSVNQEIRDLEKSLKGESEVSNSNIRRLKMLRKCREYLSDGPREDFIKKQLELCNKKIDRIERGFWQWKKDNHLLVSELQNPKKGRPKNVVSYYRKINDVPKLKNQIRHLKYLLE